MDDNFIANRKRACEFLGAMTEWRARVGATTGFLTEASVNLVDHEDLCELMVAARRRTVAAIKPTPCELYNAADSK